MSLIELNIRGVPDRLLRSYLLELGAATDPQDRDAPRMTGDGYTVSWSSERVDLAGGTLKLTSSTSSSMVTRPASRRSNRS